MSRVGTGPSCLYPTNYRLLANVLGVGNNPSDVDGTGAPLNPIFTYTIEDPSIPAGQGQSITLTPGEVQNQRSPDSPPWGTPTPPAAVWRLQLRGPRARHLGGHRVPSRCHPERRNRPADPKPGADSAGVVENSLVVYRYAQSPGSTTAPYQYSATVDEHDALRHRNQQIRDRNQQRPPQRTDFGRASPTSGPTWVETAMVPVLAITLIISIVGATLVANLRAVDSPSGEHLGRGVRPPRPAGRRDAYVTAINANPSLAQCSTSTNGSGTCSGIDYGQWNLVSASTPSPGVNSVVSTTPSATRSRRSTRPPMR